MIEACDDLIPSQKLLFLFDELEATPAPATIASDTTLAADVADQYIMIGDALHNMETAAQQFVLAHELVHYREQHNTYDTVVQCIYLPLCAALLIGLALIYMLWYQRARTVAWLHDWALGVQHVCRRTLGHHHASIQSILYGTCHMATCSILIAMTALTCAQMHDYWAKGCMQHLEYRADIGALYATHNADTACRIFCDDHIIPSYHPHDAQRRSYIRYSQAHNYRSLYWRELPCLLTVQQMCGAALHAITGHIPLTNMTWVWSLCHGTCYDI